MPDARGLHCPNCGAAADPDAGRCPYCQARLATVSCPSCFALMFDGSVYCPQCGAPRSRQEAGDATARCPGCGGDLRKVDVGKTTLVECAKCDGAWLDAKAFEALCADGEAQAAVLHRYAGRGEVAKTAVKYRRCLHCGKMMNRVNFGRLSGTIVDVCRGHGTYLDTGELHQIVTFIRGGGMERARQHQLDELRQEQQKLQALEWRVRARDAMNTSGSGWNDHSFLHFITQLDIGPKE
ncbi:MAG: zinc ribbon domain-containing protein [Vicinamibacterales bacterium]